MSTVGWWVLSIHSPPRANLACASRWVKGRKLIPEGVCSRTVSFVWAIWGSLPCTGTYYTRHWVPWAQSHFELSSVDSWFREIPVLRACLFSNRIQFSRKKLCLCWVDRCPNLVWASYLATLLWRKGDEDYFSQNYVYVLRTTRTRHMVSFIDFYFHFLGNVHYRQSNVRWLLPAYDYCFVVCTVLNDLITAHSVVVESWEEPLNLWLRVAKNAFVSWALNVWIRMLLKGAVRKQNVELKKQMRHLKQSSTSIHKHHSWIKHWLHLTKTKMKVKVD